MTAAATPRHAFHAVSNAMPCKFGYLYRVSSSRVILGDMPAVLAPCAPCSSLRCTKQMSNPSCPTPILCHTYIYIHNSTVETRRLSLGPIQTTISSLRPSTPSFAPEVVIRCRVGLVLRQSTVPLRPSAENSRCSTLRALWSRYGHFSRGAN